MMPPKTLGAELALVLDRLMSIETRRSALTLIAGLIQQNVQQEQKYMSQITDWAAQEQADLTTISTTLDTVVAGVAALDKLITDFQNSPGTLSAADQAALDGIQSASHALVAKAQAISVTPPTHPPSV
jgi:broad specificity polyphosphatase/5'/3'-nucleotidase SurE